MADSSRIVRLTYEELHGMAQEYRKTTTDLPADDKPKKQRRPDRVLYQTPSVKGGKPSGNERRSKNTDEREEQRSSLQQPRHEEGSLRRQLPDVVSDIGENPVSSTSKPSVEITGNDFLSKSVASVSSSSNAAKTLVNTAGLREHLARSTTVAGSVISSVSEQSVLAQQSTNEQPKRVLGRGRNRMTDDVKAQPGFQTPTFSVSSILLSSPVADAPNRDDSTGSQRQLSDFYRAKSDASTPTAQGTAQQSNPLPQSSDTRQSAGNTKPDAAQLSALSGAKRSVPERPRPSATAATANVPKPSATGDAKIVQNYAYSSPEDEKYVPDEDVEESVNARTFQGLVFTSNRPEPIKKRAEDLPKQLPESSASKKGGGQLYEARGDDNKGRTGPTRQDSSKKHVSYGDGGTKRDVDEDGPYNSRTAEQHKASTRATPDRTIASSTPSQADNRRGRNNSERSSVSDDRALSAKNTSDRRGADDQHAHHDRGQGRVEEKEWPQAAKGGGILHLPPTQMKQMTSQAADVSQARQSSGVKMTQAPSQQVPRGPSGRTLYDPNNPTDHHRSSPPDSHFVDSPKQQLHFIETGDAKISPDVMHPPFPGAYGGGRNFPTSPQYPGPMQPYGQGPMPMMWHPGMRPPDPSYPYPPPNFFPYRPGVYPGPGQYPGDYMSQAVNPASRSEAESLLQSVIPLENQLTTLVTQGVSGVQGLQKLLSLRRDVQHQLQQIMMLDLELATSQNVELLLWRSFYQVIEMFRRYLDTKTDEYIRECLEGLIDEATLFYESLLEKLQTTYDFTLEHFLNGSRPHPDIPKRLTKLAVMSSQRVMICLGDLARYREQAHMSSNFGKAKSWYQKAQQVYPKNGRPFYQLAVLALSTKHKLDAIYYYVRSLATGNPVVTARESMATLFEETNKKAAEVYEKKKREGKEKGTPREEVCDIEVWISIDGAMSESAIANEAEMAELEELSKMPGTELNKQLVMSYINVHGKLFSKIGMETFRESEMQMLREFNALLHNSPLPVSDFRLLQLMAINMFSVENAITKEGAVSETSRPLHVMRAVQTMLDMFGLVLRRLAELTSEVLRTKQPLLPLREDLRALLAAAKVWSDWMLGHLVLWNPPPQLPAADACSRIVDVWQSIAELCNILKDVETTRVEIKSALAEGFVPLLLTEDVTMTGYIPLAGRGSTPVYVPASSNKELAQDCVRIARFKTFGDYLCGIQNPLLLYNVDTNHYESLYRRPSLLESQLSRQLSINDNFADVPERAVASRRRDQGTAVHYGDEPERIRELRGRKEELERQRRAYQHQEATRVSLLEGPASQHVLEVRPDVLVPDTNCFIDHLSALEVLLTSRRFKVVVPLIVITELDGLARGARGGQFGSDMHARKVGEGAAAAIRYLEEKFRNRCRQLWAMTSDFTLLDTIAYRHEQPHKLEKNDDVILSICQSFCEERTPLPLPDASNRLLRTVVLLTDDRNLRLKAHSSNIPVRDVGAFMKWAKLAQ